jgi:ferric-dicitrate binding protein FerR (iron transport regulator)
VNSRIKELFERYGSGQATPEERALVEQWFASYDADQAEDAAEKQSFAQMDGHIEKVLSGSKIRRININRWLQVAAVFFIAAGLCWFALQKPEKPVNVITYSKIVTPRGLKKEFSLPDGTLVYLNSGSVLRIPSNFNQKTRSVLLEGEGFFEVKHNASRPFSITSGKLLITDLGTAFDVKAYPRDHVIKVAVESGEVKVEKNIPGKTPETFARSVTHNQQLTYNDENNRHSLSLVQTDNMIAWRKNQLRFDNASFDEISLVLERWYNVSVKFSNYHACRRYTVSFNNEPLSKVLKVLSGLTGMHYQINDQTITLNLKNCKS